MKKEFDTCSYGFVTADPKAQLIHIGENTLRVKPTQVNLMAHLIGHADTSVALPDLQEELGIRSKESFKVTVSSLRGALKKVSLAEGVKADLLVLSTIPAWQRPDIQSSAHYSLNKSLIDAIASGSPLDGIQTKPSRRLIAPHTPPTPRARHF